MVDVMPFAQALYDVADESHKDVLFLDQLKDLSEIWRANVDLVHVLKHPKVKRDQKDDLIRDILSNGVDEVLVRFVRVLNKYDLAAYMPQIYRSYMHCFNEAHHIESVDVESASALTAQQLEALKDILEKKLNKRVELNVKVDPSLIAGLRVRTDQFVLDNTVIAKAEVMKEQIKKN